MHVCLCAYGMITPYDTCCLLHASLQTIDMCDYTTTRSFVKRTGKVCGEVGDVRVLGVLWAQLVIMWKGSETILLALLLLWRWI